MPAQTATKRKRRVCLWGFSMGAVACLLYAHESRGEHVQAMVLDSPFSNFRDLVFTHPQALSLPRFTVPALRVVFPLYRRAVRRRSGCGLDVNQHLDVAAAARGIRADLPAMFVSAEGDLIVPCSHGQTLTDTYGGSPKEHLQLRGLHHDHNSVRPRQTLSKLADFLKPHLEAC
mmetsp:Transcript_35875/g.73109  ORF Transcript_35875/g.73109 Transcript_35875/m.73109 type:complete len:174 (+) Transcript_35875:721-1242(+)